MMISDGFGYSKLKVSGFCRTSKNHKIFAPHVTHSGPEILQKSRTKKLVKSNTSISRKKIFLTKFHFLPFQKWPKINFCTGKKFKTAKNAISRIKNF